jgi:GTP-binding protein LepA
MSNDYLKYIRNFSIIAHIDHGKSTLADRLLEFTNTVDKRKMQAQMLDSMDLERERGLTIKAKAVQQKYPYKGTEYTLNLIDTPGHVDFSYEVSRSLIASEGALLVTDASQGVEAQTMANTHIAVNFGLALIPVINKIDMPNADPEAVMIELEELIAIPAEEGIKASAKDGIGIEEILEAVILRIKPPVGDMDAPLKALIMDAQFDYYKGVIIFVRLYDGVVKKGMKISMMAAGASFDVIQVGFFKPDMVEADELKAGETGYIMAGIKSLDEIKIGDTVTTLSKPCDEALAGYQEIKPMVFCGLFPIDSHQYEDLKDALLKLQLNDSSLKFLP